jgi:hypothetical protein
MQTEYLGLEPKILYYIKEAMNFMNNDSKDKIIRFSKDSGWFCKNCNKNYT